MSLALSTVSYSLAGAMAATGLGETTIREAMNSGELIVHYAGSKPIFRAADLDEWVQSMPTEKPKSS